MWTIAAANKKLNGPLGSYNGLTDVHLAHFFSRPSHQSHLKTARLITSDGTIIPEQKVKIASIQYEKKKKIYELLANTVIQNAAHKEGSWNKKLCNYLENVSKIENVEKLKVGPRKSFRNDSRKGTFQGLNLCEWFKDCEWNALTIPRSAHSACKCCFKDSLPLHPSISKLKRCFSAKETSPYNSLFLCSSHAHRPQNGLCQIVTLQRRKKKHKKNVMCEKIKNLGSNYTSNSKLTKLSIPDQSFKIDQCKVVLFYHGHSPLPNSQINFTEKVLIRQQHCGGTSVIVYKGQVALNETLSFISLSHEDTSFSITVFLDGIRYLKLSSCCVFRYSPSRRLGGSSGCFSIQSIEGGKPCIKCQYIQVETSSKDMKQKLMSLKNAVSLELDKDDGLASNFYEKKDVSGNYIAAVNVCENESFEVTKYHHDHIETEADSSVVSEIINSSGEEIEENIFDNHETDVDNEVIEEENELEGTNISFHENVNVTKESSFGSESSTNSIAESVKNLVRTDIKSYASESSDDEDGGKQHIVMVSIHGSPKGGL